MSELKLQARIAGFLYLLVGVTSVVSLSIVPSWIMVAADASTITTEITASELLYRVGVLVDVAGQMISVIAILALYQLLRPVEKTLAGVMLALGLVGVPMSFANLLLGMAPLVFLSGADYLSAFEAREIDALVVSLLSLRGYGVRASMVLWGAILLPFGLLVVRSGFIPRILGILLIVGCFAHLTVGVTSLLLPAFAGLISSLQVLAIGEILIIFYLLIWGVQAERSNPPSAQITSLG